MAKRLKVLLSAYACEPDRGSEPEVGWQWAMQLARYHDVTVLTRANNRGPIEAGLASHTGPHPRFVYYDLPHWARFWKRGGRGVQAYYFLWQQGVYRLARHLHATECFDLVHHVTFGKFSTPTSLTKLSVPVVVGPVGGGESTPPGFARTYSFQGKLHEIARDAGRRFTLANPQSRRLLRRARALIAATPETAAWFGPDLVKTVLIEPQCGMTEADLQFFAGFPLRRKLPFRLISIARLVHWKAIHLGLRAFARFAADRPTSEYWIVSSGPEESQLRHLAAELGVASKVVFWGRLPLLKDVHAKLAQCDVLLHPALHEAFGYACLEALAAGRPVVCLNWGGPGLQVTEQCGFAIQPETVDQVVTDFAVALKALYDSPELRAKMSEAGRLRTRNQFHWDKKGHRMDAIYRELSTGNRGTS